MKKGFVMRYYKFLRRTGATGIIMVILMLGFLMTLSISYIQMNRNENLGNTYDIYQNRAKAAAMSGINFAAATLTSRGDASADSKSRIYFIRSDSTADRNLLINGASFSDTTLYTNIATSQWYYVSSPSGSLSTEAASGSLFRLHSYYDSGVNIATAYYVKSQGLFREIATASTEIVATYQSQILSRFNLDSGIVKIDAYRQTDYENDKDFFEKRPKLQ
ncbi:MAG: hypothetical protein HQM10_18725 [Candidatus Riflebacteria bacterium]|nr:hypothetical protein [Candidatus Riflebacteria bacterium]